MLIIVLFSVFKPYLKQETNLEKFRTFGAFMTATLLSTRPGTEAGYVLFRTILNHVRLPVMFMIEIMMAGFILIIGYVHIRRLGPLKDGWVKRDGR